MENQGLSTSHEVADIIDYWFREGESYNYHGKACYPDHYNSYTCEHYIRVSLKMHDCTVSMCIMVIAPNCSFYNHVLLISLHCRWCGLGHVRLVVLSQNALDCKRITTDTTVTTTTTMILTRVLSSFWSASTEVPTLTVWRTCSTLTIPTEQDHLAEIALVGTLSVIQTPSSSMVILPLLHKISLPNLVELVDFVVSTDKTW